MGRRLQSLLVVTLALAIGTACKDKSEAKLESRCEQLAKACGEKDKHVEILVAECTQAANKQVEKSCADQAIALYDCYEKSLCTKEKVWALDDFRVLANRHGKCKAEREALDKCVEKK
jgi:hypothetical protein